MITWPDPNAPRAEVDAFGRVHAPTPPEPNGIPHGAPPVASGPSIVCNACGVVRVGLYTPFCKGCLAQLEAAGVEVP